MRFQKVLNHHIITIQCFVVNAKFTDGNWILTHTGEYCSERISSMSGRNSLSKCKTYCQTNNFNRLEYMWVTGWDDGFCRCCSASSALTTSSSSTYFYEVYTFSGNHKRYHSRQNRM